MDSIYLTIFAIDLVGMALLLFLMAVLSVIYYLNQTAFALKICVVMFVSNLVFTYLTLQGGVNFYGYGFTLAMLVSCVVALHYMNLSFQKLEYLTFTFYE